MTTVSCIVTYEVRKTTLPNLSDIDKKFADLNGLLTINSLPLEEMITSFSFGVLEAALNPLPDLTNIRLLSKQLHGHPTSKDCLQLAVELRTELSNSGILSSSRISSP